MVNYSWILSWKVSINFEFHSRKIEHAIENIIKKKDFSHEFALCNNFHGLLRWLLTTFDWIVLFTGNSDFGIFSLWLLIRGRWSHMEALLCYSHKTNCGILLYPLTKNLLVCFQDWKDSVANTTTNLKKINKKNPSSKIRHILHSYHMHSLLLACDKPHIISVA